MPSRHKKFRNSPRPSFQELRHHHNIDHVIDSDHNILTHGDHVCPHPKISHRNQFDGTFTMVEVPSFMVGATQPTGTFSVKTITPSLPSDIGSTVGITTNPTFSPGSGDGIHGDCHDVQQYGISDCYYISPCDELIELALYLMNQIVVKNSDGTYTVKFYDTASSTIYNIIVNNQININGNPCRPNPMTGAIGIPILEKAYAWFKTRGANPTYSSLNWGFPSVAFTDLGCGIVNVTTGNAAGLASILVQYSRGMPMVLTTPGTITQNAPLIPSHVYSVLSINLDSLNNPISVIVYNPWGVDGIGLDGNPSDGIVTLSWPQLCANNNGYLLLVNTYPSYLNLTKPVVSLSSSSTTSIPSNVMPTTSSSSTTANTTPINVALFGTTLSSSNYNNNIPGYGPQNAINGDRTGKNWGNGGGWSALAMGPGSWLEVDFPTSQTISEIDIFSTQDQYTNPTTPTPTMLAMAYGLVDFDLQYWDGSNFVLIPGGNIRGNTLVWCKVSFSPITTSKIRIIPITSRDGWIRVVELEAWTIGTTTVVPSPLPVTPPTPTTSNTPIADEHTAKGMPLTAAWFAKQGL